MGKWLCGALLLAAILPFGARALAGSRESVSRFAFVREVNAPESDQGVWSIEMDAHVYAHSALDFGDLRLVAANGAIVPYGLQIMRQQRVTMRETPVPARTVSFSTDPAANTMTIVVEATDDDATVTALDIETELTDFERKVDVAGSADGSSWTTLATRQSIVDYSRFIDVRSTRISVPPSTFRQFRVVVSDVTDEQALPLKQVVRDALTGEAAREFESLTLNRRDFRIEAIALLGPRSTVSEEAPVYRTFEAPNLAIRPTGRSTVVTCDGGGIPLARLDFTIGDQNFSRRVVVRGVPFGRSGPWQSVGSGTISRIAFGGAIRQCVSLAVTGVQRWKRLEITLEDRDNPPLAIQGLSLVAETRQLVFFAHGAGLRQLYYGDAMATKPVYDVGDVLAAGERVALQACRLGAPTDNPAFGKGRLPTFGGKGLLVGAIFVAAVALLWLVVRALGKMKALEREG
jgi:hypothetical protein